MRNKIFWIVLLIGVVAVFYLSWVAQPKLSSLWFMPSWLGKWTDAGGNENLRTAVPFLLLGGLSGVWLAKKNMAFRQWVIALALLILVATVAEVGQLFLAQRTCDVGDILWGTAGSFVGLVIVSFSRIRISFVKKTASKYSPKIPDYSNKVRRVSAA